jgi:hypothetical protein
MSDTIIAQKREGYNDTIHLYRDEIKTRYSVRDGGYIETRVAYCSKRLEMRPDVETLELGKRVLEADYFKRNGQVVGKICENCRKAYEGVCHAND